MVARGNGIARVLETGARSQIGRIGQSLATLEIELGKSEWIATKRPTIADIGVYGVLRYLPEANIDLTETLPALDLYDNNWPIWTYSEVTPPAKFVHDLEGRRGSAVASLVSGGCIVSGAAIKRSMLSPNVRVNSFSSLEEAVVLPSVHIQRNVHLKKVVIDTSVVIPEGLVVGEDPELDAKRFRRTASGICLITQPMIDRLAL